MWRSFFNNIGEKHWGKTCGCIKKSFSDTAMSTLVSASLRGLPGSFPSTLEGAMYLHWMSFKSSDMPPSFESHVMCLMNLHELNEFTNMHFRFQWSPGGVLSFFQPEPYSLPMERRIHSTNIQIQLSQPPQNTQFWYWLESNKVIVVLGAWHKPNKNWSDSSRTIPKHQKPTALMKLCT